MCKARPRGTRKLGFDGMKINRKKKGTPVWGIGKVRSLSELAPAVFLFLAAKKTQRGTRAIVTSRAEIGEAVWKYNFFEITASLSALEEAGWITRESSQGKIVVELLVGGDSDG